MRNMFTSRYSRWLLALHCGGLKLPKSEITKYINDSISKYVEPIIYLFIYLAVSVFHQYSLGTSMNNFAPVEILPKCDVTSCILTLKVYENHAASKVSSWSV